MRAMAPLDMLLSKAYRSRSEKRVRDIESPAEGLKPAGTIAQEGAGGAVPDEVGYPRGLEVDHEGAGGHPFQSQDPRRHPRLRRDPRARADPPRLPRRRRVAGYLPGPLSDRGKGSGGGSSRAREADAD